MYKIINQLTKQEEDFENRDDLLSKLEIINERMKSNRISGSYQLYFLTTEGEILQELTLDMPFVEIIDQLLENFGTSDRKKKKGLLDFLARHKNKSSKSKQYLDPEDDNNVTAQEADLERDRIAKLVTGKSELGKPETKSEDSETPSEWTTELFSRLDAEEEEHLQGQAKVSESVPKQETVPVVKKPAQEEVSEILDRKEEKHSFEPSYEVSHVAAVDLTSEVVDSFEVQTIAYKQSIKQQIQFNEKYINDANEEIIACQNRINELQQQILAKEEQAAKLKDLYFKIDEVS
ncbi:Uncharacterised protein [Streptococcus cristatus]|uniref:Uncharacterized protein n=2 Tax=Streptococcus cristatus TaxID=45634 RepID=A0A512A9D0_STRCR|nr:hypothetical protein [Streptococcus cristatus]AGK70877.1 hypothetical protein I872_03905 [Streptococcus cristatus AS 1.3089]GEN96308.1 hypothetical protein SOL01_01820 [Streptococcus cristatus]SQI47321.1 Uncharacterised protein [Streptococcus cristatus]